MTRQRVGEFVSTINSETQAAQPLFRHAVTEALTNHQNGVIRLAQPISYRLAACVSFLIASCLVAYVVCGTVTRRTRVTGIVIPAGGTLTVAAPNSGVLVKSFVEEGQHVHAGQPLFEIAGVQRSSNGEITALISQQLNVRRDAVENERRILAAQIMEKRSALDQRISNTKAEMAQLENDLVLARRRQQLAQNTLEKYEILKKEGFVADAQVQQKQEELLDQIGKCNEISRAITQTRTTQFSLSSDRALLTSDLEANLIQLRQKEAGIAQEAAENQGRHSNTVVAPEAGEVTTITYQKGQSVTSGQPLATLVPDRSAADGKSGELEVHLYAQSRAAGFVATGQRVLVRIGAFPYQKYGLQEGHVMSVSTTPYAPAELPANVASTILSNAQQDISGSRSNEGLYRIRVRLNAQTIHAFGRNYKIKYGMTADADILQDQRRIWEWIAEPLLAVARR
jgi:membrane fusion protein